LIVAFIAAGILVGPPVPGWVSANGQIDLLVKLGITLLLFFFIVPLLVPSMYAAREAADRLLRRASFEVAG